MRGEARLPGDKSISHRALILGALSVGLTEIEGLLESDDVLATAEALNALGAEVVALGSGRWQVAGRGVGGLAEPDRPLDLGNSGTSARLLMGVVASHPFTAFLTGDASLRGRPMARVAAPLEQMGARVLARSGCRLPLAVSGAADPVPIVYRLPVPSAQVKSAVLLAGLNAPGETTLIEPVATRDHTERMLAHFGADIRLETGADKPPEVGADKRLEAPPGGSRAITLLGHPELRGARVGVPGDISSAAFPLAAALLVEGSEIVLRQVGVNPLRAGLLETLQDMGADIELSNQQERCGEPVADLRVRASKLQAVDVPPERAPSMIDEFPILAVLAACAMGKSRFRGLAELRVKESDRLDAIATGLTASGVRAEISGDDLVIEGTGAPPRGGATVASRLDHRIAMAFLVLGLVARKPVTVDDGSPIATSFPEFSALMNSLGATISDG